MRPGPDRVARALRLLVAVSAALLLLGCGPAPVTVSTGAEGAPARIALAGSGTAQPLIEFLAERYHEQNPHVTFDFMPQMHSGGGIKGAAEGMFDIGIVSREPNDEERALGLRYVVVSLDGLALASNSADLGVDSLTSQQVRDIYSGAVTNWAELGGQDADIVVLDRNEDESAKIVLRRFVLGPPEELVITERAASLNQESDMIDGLVNTASTVGYLSLGYALLEDLPIHLLALDGVEPTTANIQNGSYVMVRALGVVVPPEASEATQAFVSYMTSAAAHEAMAPYYAPGP